VTVCISSSTNHTRRESRKSPIYWTHESARSRDAGRGLRPCGEPSTADWFRAWPSHATFPPLSPIMHPCKEQLRHPRSRPVFYVHERALVELAISRRSLTTEAAGGRQQRPRGDSTLLQLTSGRSGKPAAADINRISPGRAGASVNDRPFGEDLQRSTRPARETRAGRARKDHPKTRFFLTAFKTRCYD
jgi:hypothetical protein